MRRVVEAGVCTRKGRLHDNNEDCHHVDVHDRIVVLADGMGGHKAGEVASRLAVQAVATYVDDTRRANSGSSQARRRSTRSRLRRSILSADELLLEAQQENPEKLGGMGCALVAIRWGWKYWHVCHVGDTRVYAYSSAGLEQSTHDHSAATDLVESGFLAAEDAARHPLRHHLTQAVGRGDVRPESLAIPIVVGSKDKPAWLVVCSDGVWDALGGQAMLSILKRSRGVRVAARRLVNSAWHEDGRDDCTVAIVGIRGLSDTPKKSILRAGS